MAVLSPLAPAASPVGAVLVGRPVGFCFAGCLLLTDCPLYIVLLVYSFAMCLSIEIGQRPVALLAFHLSLDPGPLGGGWKPSASGLTGPAPAPLQS